MSTSYNRKSTNRRKSIRYCEVVQEIFQCEIICNFWFFISLRCFLPHNRMLSKAENFPDLFTIHNSFAE